ncbi:MAG TPA: hypothetical protein VGJ86_12515 [Acidimicrobiales bacterium]
MALRFPDSKQAPDADVVGELGAGLSERPDRTRYRELLTTLTRSARTAGRGAVISGQWLAETVIDTAPRVPIRDVETLSRHHEGLTGEALARSMIRSSGRVSASIGAAAGGLVAVQELSVAAALAIPFELAAETALVVLVELKLVAELHQVAGRPLPGGPREQVAGAVRSWLSGRAVSGSSLVSSGKVDLLGRTTRLRMAAALRGRMTRNLTTLAPLLAGSAIAGWLNRRFTIDVGRRVADDLGLVGDTIWRARRPRRRGWATL